MTPEEKRAYLHALVNALPVSVIEGFRLLVEACVLHGRGELPPQPQE
jgi:hypothetical protein